MIPSTGHSVPYLPFGATVWNQTTIELLYQVASIACCLPVLYGSSSKAVFIVTSDVDPDPQNLINPDPDPVRIQVNKITTFSKHLLIFKRKKNL